MKKIISLVLLITLLCAGSVSADENIQFEKLDKTILYCSPNASAGGDGTIDNPFRTMAEARDKIRELKNNGELGKDGACVYLREGRYEFNETFWLEEQDSGTEDAPIVYRGYKDEKAVITGSKRLSLNDFKTVTDPEILNTVIEESARPKIKSLDLKALGFRGKEPYFLWDQDDGGNNVQPRFKSDIVFTVDGTKYVPARYPNGDEMCKVSEVISRGEDADWYNPLKAADPKYIPLGERDYDNGIIFKSSDKRYLKWKNQKRGGIYGYFGVGWLPTDINFVIDEEAETIKATHVIRVVSEFKTGGVGDFNANHLLEELDIPGEYWTDGNGTMYTILPDDANSETIISLATIIGTMPVVAIKGSYITFSNLTFGESGTKVIEIVDGATNCEILNCVNEGDGQIVVQGMNNGVKGCTTHNQIRFNKAGDSDTLTPCNNYAINNHVCGFPRAYGISSYGAIGIRIAHNDVHNTIGGAIEVFGEAEDKGCQLNVVEYNHIWDVCQTATDGSAIYTGYGATTSYGNIYRYNYIHDLNNIHDAFNLSGIYLDDGTSGSLCVGNIIVDFPRGFHLSGSRDTTLYNNIVIDASNCGVNFDDRSTWINMTDPELGRIHRSLRNVAYRSEIWKERFPLLYNIYDNNPNMAMGTKSFNNMFINCAPDKEASSFLDLYNEGNARLKSEPGFIDAENGNYLLTLEGMEKISKELPDFKQIPVTRIGTYNERAYERVKNAVVLGLNMPNAIVKGEITAVDENDESIIPLLSNGTTYVPIRFIVESFGAEVSYNDETSCVKIETDDASISMIMNSTEVVKNGEIIEATGVPVKYNDRVYVPLRMVSELLNYKVFWDEIGLIGISEEDLFNPESDKDIIEFLYDEITIY